MVDSTFVYGIFREGSDVLGNLKKIATEMGGALGP